MIEDEHDNRIPVGCFIIGNKENIHTVMAGLRGWLLAVRCRVKGAADWIPSCASLWSAMM